VGGLAVQGVTCFVQGTQTCQGIVHLQQRPTRVVPHAAVDVFWRGAQVDHIPAFMQVATVGLSQHRAATGGEHAVVVQAQVIEHCLLDIPEGLFPLAGEVFTDGAAQAFLDHMVRVDKRHPQTPGQLASDGGFACTRQTDKNDAQDRLTHEGDAGPLPGWRRKPSSVCERGIRLRP